MSGPIANTFMIGAQKSGTTYLASLLAQHADICVSDPKEPQFFGKEFDRGFEFYSRCFARPDAKIRLDASTTYTFLRPRHLLDEDGAPGYTENIPQRIKDHSPNAKFIYIMRDPVKRMMSMIRHGARNDERSRGGTVTLQAAVERNPMALLISKYADQIERYLEVWDKSDFLFLRFEDLKDNPQEVTSQVLDFLELSPLTLSLDAAKEDQHGAYRYTTAGRVLNQLGGAKSLARKALPAPLHRWIKSSIATAPSDLTFTEIDVVAPLLDDDRQRVFELTGLRI
ncbi:sulfotransferase domain-containing protein [Algirhabdus cladophorae]|uniref:sulfotransferase domain-containing protein n=1 Tax=Algirhabdus cladophorae TaxID=3377108 RepID=UPI003B84B18A